MLGKKPILRDHCCTAEWTRGLSTTLALDLPYFIEKNCVHTSHTLDISSVQSVERAKFNVQLRQP